MENRDAYKIGLMPMLLLVLDIILIIVVIIMGLVIYSQKKTIEKNVADSCNNLALTLADIGKTGEAELLYREALEIRRRLAAREPDIEKYVADSCDGLGVLLKEAGRTAEADRFYG